MFRTEPLTMQLVSMALDAASLRQQAIAANIANASTPGYRPVRVSFEDQLDFARQQLGSGSPVAPGALAGVRPQLVRGEPQAEGSGSIGLDVQTAELAQNAIQYQALLKGLSHHFSIMSTIINEGKR